VINGQIFSFITGTAKRQQILSALNGVGAGIGEDVIIAQGSSARMGMKDVNAPVDALIIGILDEKQV